MAWPRSNLLASGPFVPPTKQTILSPVSPLSSDVCSSDDGTPSPVITHSQVADRGCSSSDDGTLAFVSPQVDDEQDVHNRNRQHLAGEDIVNSAETRRHFHEIKAVTFDSGIPTRFFARFNDGTKLGPDVRVGFNKLESVSETIFTEAANKADHPTNPWVGVGLGATSPVAAYQISGAALEPTGSQTSPLIGCAAMDGDHVDARFHCVDGSIYNLLRHKHPSLAKSIAPYLTTEETMRMRFDQIGDWLDKKFPQLQVRHLNFQDDDLLGHIQSLAVSAQEALLLVAVSGNTHCIAADCARNEWSDVATGMRVPISSQDAFDYLAIPGIDAALFVEFKETPKVQKRRRARKPKAPRKKVCVLP